MRSSASSARLVPRPEGPLILPKLHLQRQSTDERTHKHPPKMTVSTPGKVLITGGYLVLDKQFSGLVVATDARFFTRVAKGATNQVVVESKQFEEGRWVYNLTLGSEPGSVALESVHSRNAFVEWCLLTCLALAHRAGKVVEGLEVEICGDNDFYSQRNELARLGLALTAENLASLPRHCPTHTTLGKVSKTGLGSSAAMVTSLVGSLLQHFELADVSTQHGKVYAHNLAQLCHCLAQGKIGSGFDVSAAAFGSHAYRRFSPTVLEKAVKLLEGRKATCMESAQAIHECISAKWDSEVAPFTLPPGLRLVLADIDAGSSTPKLVSKLLDWRKTKPQEADSLWKSLDESNTAVEQLLRRLSAVGPSTEYDDALERIASSNWTATSQTMTEFIHLKQHFVEIRAKMREMSSRADVPVEPPEQTRLLDACYALPGVICGGVPGAGGFDAIFLLVVDRPDVVQGVRACWQAWSEMDVGPLLCKQSDGGFELVE